MTEVASIVVFTDRLADTAAFYRAVGVQLIDEDHGDGERHAAAEVGAVHVAVLAAAAARGSTPSGWTAAGTAFVGFYVDSLDETVAELRALGAKVLVEHQVRDWGCRSVLADSDGRAVEINQRAYCQDPPAA